MNLEKEDQTTTHDEKQRCSNLQKRVGGAVPAAKPENASFRKLAEALCLKSMFAKLAVWQWKHWEAVIHFLSVSKE